MPIRIGASYVSEAAVEYAKTEQIKREEKDTKFGKNSVLSELQEKFKGLNITVGAKPFSGAGKNNLSISPKILKEMEKDPEKRLEYEALIYDIANLSEADWAKGRKLKSHGVIIDDNGGCRGWSVSEYNDGRNISPLNKNNKNNLIEKMLGNSTKKKNSPLKKAREKFSEKQKAAKIEISKEAREKLNKEKANNISFADTNELSKYLFQNYNIVKQGMAKISSKYLNDSLTDEKKLQSLFDNLAAADASIKEKQNEIGFQGARIIIDENGEVTMESTKSTVGFNGEKIKRQIAAAATKNDMKAVLALIEQDIKTLEDGLKNNMCDVAEVQKAKDMMTEAKEKMAKLPNRSTTPEEQAKITLNIVI